MKAKYLFILLLGAMIYSCDDLDDVTDGPGGNVPPDTGTAEFYVLSEGLFNLNNSSLLRYTFHDSKSVTDYFRQVNRRGLGDTANDIAIYGSKMYIVVNVSSQLEVVDLHTGLSVKRIPFLTENGSSRQPRYITFNRNKAYVCSFDGTVARVDTTSLEIESVIRAGRNPDGICVQNNKLYVSNSGGLDNPNYDRTVSVIDINTFTEIKKIDVGLNPGKIRADKYGDVYVVSRGSITDGNYKFVRIDSRTDDVVQAINEPVLNFTIHENLAYLYNYDYTTKTSWIKVFDVESETVIRENFITDGTSITTPYGINVNPYNGNVYITDAYNYTVNGDVLCFDPQGRLLFRVNNIGINPNTVVFSDVLSESIIDNPETPQGPSSFATRVLEYVPAPGQFMNTTTTAYKDGFSYEQVLAYATELIRKRSLLTLGGFGGYITLGFEKPIPNIPGAYDFKVYGNSYYSIDGSSGSSEPGIVMVSQDINGNGLPDDEWYELAGSEYNSGDLTRNYRITYQRPADPLGEVTWTDNQGNNGTIPRNSYHAGNSYYPQWITNDQLILTGTRLPDNGTNTGTATTEHWVQSPFAWGYADNHPNNSEFSSFKIDWAVDAGGNPVQLDKIDFVRIYTAVNQVCGWLGETSTEISTVENLHSNN